MAAMKEWKIKLYRSNPQLKNGGYETTRTIEAATKNSAIKKAKKKFEHSVYATMTVIDAELA